MVVALVGFVLVGLGCSKEQTGPGGTELGELVAKVDGVDFKSTDGMWYARGDTSWIAGLAPDLSRIQMYLLEPLTEGTYDFSDYDSLRVAIYWGYETQTLYHTYTGGLGGDGSLTITEKTGADELKGTFEFTAIGLTPQMETDTVEITDGAFFLPKVP